MAALLPRILRAGTGRPAPRSRPPSAAPEPGPPKTPGGLLARRLRFALRAGGGRNEPGAGSANNGAGREGGEDRRPAPLRRVLRRIPAARPFGLAPRLSRSGPATILPFRRGAGECRLRHRLPAAPSSAGRAIVRRPVSRRAAPSSRRRKTGPATRASVRRLGGRGGGGATGTPGRGTSRGGGRWVCGGGLPGGLPSPHIPGVPRSLRRRSGAAAARASVRRLGGRGGGGTTVRRGGERVGEGKVGLRRRPPRRRSFAAPPSVPAFPPPAVRGCRRQGERPAPRRSGRLGRDGYAGAGNESGKGKGVCGGGLPGGVPSPHPRACRRSLHRRSGVAAARVSVRRLGGRGGEGATGSPERGTSRAGGTGSAEADSPAVFLRRTYARRPRPPGFPPPAARRCSRAQESRSVTVRFSTGRSARWSASSATK